MTELKERQQHDLGGWVGESHMMRVVCAASALEETVSNPFRTGILERDWRQRKGAADLDPLFSLRALSRMDRMALDKVVLDAFATAVRSHTDAVAARLKVTPDQLYSMTFGDFIAKHEESERRPEKRKGLVEKFNEAYDEDAEREDKEFVKHLKRYHRRQFSDEW